MNETIIQIKDFMLSAAPLWVWLVFLGAVIISQTLYFIAIICEFFVLVKNKPDVGEFVWTSFMVLFLFLMLGVSGTLVYVLLI